MITSTEGNSSTPKNDPKAAATMEVREQNDFTGCYFGRATGGNRYRSIASSGEVTVVPVWWPEAGGWPESR